MTSQPQKSVILVVDDTPENIDVLKGVLQDNYIVRPAINGMVALKAVLVEPLPDLVLLDVMMPGMNGYEVCRRLKEDPRTREIPVIFVTAKTEVADELQGLELGAVDYIIKPYRPPIVQARVKTHLALRHTRRQLEQRNRLLQEERELIEGLILKMRRADWLDPRHLRYLITSVEETAGDILMSTFAPDGRQMVCLGDFTGHGLPAAIGAPLVTYIFHTMVKSGQRGEEILVELNRQLAARLPASLFFAACLLEIDPARQQATLWNAGVPDGWLVQNGVIAHRFPSVGLPLGILPSLPSGFAGISMPVQPEDRFYLFSDGVLEAKSPDGALFGEERLETSLFGVLTRKADLDELLPILTDFSQSPRREDDITLVEITV